MKIFNLFPLTILEDAIEITDEDRDTLVQSIIKMKSDNEDNKKSDYAWTGDTKGHGFLTQSLII